jgi:peptidoglycan/LPS O-acetylase OafA/YrhL
MLFICFWIKILFLKIDYSDEISFLTFEEHMFTQTLYFILFLLFIKNKLNFIANKKTIFLGKISFALYLIHQFVSLKYLIPYTSEYLKLNFWFSSLFIVLPIVIILATLITFYIEIPLNRRLNKLFLKRNNQF